MLGILFEAVPSFCFVVGILLIISSDLWLINQPPWRIPLRNKGFKSWPYWGKPMGFHKPWSEGQLFLGGGYLCGGGQVWIAITMILTLRKFNSSPLKNDAWKTFSFPSGFRSLFMGKLAVKPQVGIVTLKKTKQTTLPKFNIAPESYLPNRKVVLQPPFFWGKLAVKLLGYKIDSSGTRSKPSSKSSTLAWTRIFSKTNIAFAGWKMDPLIAWRCMYGHYWRMGAGYPAIAMLGVYQGIFWLGDVP